MLPTSPPDATRFEFSFLADALTRASDAIKWVRALVMPGLEKTSEITLISGYCCVEDLVGTSLFERTRVYVGLAGERPGWCRAMREILDSRAPPGANQLGKHPASRKRAYMRRRRIARA